MRNASLQSGFLGSAMAIFFVLIFALAWQAKAADSTNSSASISNALINKDEKTLYKKATEILDEYTGDTSTLQVAALCLEKILEVNPNHALAYVQMARVAYKSGYLNYDNYHPESLQLAKKYLAKALELNPKLFEAYIASAYVSLYEKDLDAAAKMVQEARNIKSSDPDIALLHAHIAEKKNNLDEAVEYAKEVLSIGTENRQKIAALEILGPIYKSRKQFDLADQTYQEQLTISSHSPWVKVNYSNFLTRQGKYDKAIEMGKSALEEMDFGMGHHILATAYLKKANDLCFKQKDHETAEKNYTLALEQEPTIADAYYGLGVCYRFISYKLKSRPLLDKSEQSFKKALELDPNHALAKKELEKHAAWVNKR